MYSTLKPAVKKTLTQTFKAFGIAVTRYHHLQQLEERGRVVDYMELLLGLPRGQKDQLLKIVQRSRSQLGQDLFVLSELNFKRGGFFVEFGATDGLQGSNTYLLEKEFGWHGIVGEPARGWHKDLKNNRDCHIETSCVWSESNSTVVFQETDVRDLSTIDSYRSSDFHGRFRNKGKSYGVNTISLEDLLEKYNAPPNIDYLSIDTEGSEFDILRKVDFDKYQFGVITCEHNFAPLRESIFSLLTQNGYVRKLEEVSKVDDWYVRAESV